MAEDPTSNAKFGPVIGLEAPGVDELQEGRPVITASGWDFNKPKQKVLITGVRGFIGNHLWNSLNAYYDITGIDNLSGLGSIERQSPYTHLDILTDELPDVNYDWVIHLAAQPGAVSYTHLTLPTKA